MLEQLTDGQMKTLTSFIYVQGNEFCDALYKQIKDYLKVRPPLLELKLINVALFNGNLMNNLLVDLRNDFKLTTLCLSKVGLGTMAVETIAGILKAR